MEGLLPLDRSKTFGNDGRSHVGTFCPPLRLEELELQPLPQAHWLP